MSAQTISVIIPVYNHARELEKTLASVFGQTYRPLQVVIVDDGSTDDLETVLARWQEQPELKIVHQENQGAAAARNRGFRASSGELVIFWDADLLAQPRMLEKMVAVLAAKPEISFVYSSFYFGWKKFPGQTFNLEALWQANYIHTTALLRCEHFFGFDESLQKFQDWDLWLTMAEAGHRGYWLNEYLFKIKTRRNGYSNWLPSFIYRFPWLPIPALKKYVYWRNVIRKKHHL